MIEIFWPSHEIINSHFVLDAMGDYRWKWMQDRWMIPIHGGLRLDRDQDRNRDQWISTVKFES